MVDHIIKENKVDNDTAQSLRDLKVLEAIEEDSSISQRDLSNRLGVALGITNSLIKTLVRKGHIKIKGKNNRTLSYHLTHLGVLHKSKLAMQWTLNTVGEYRRLRALIAERLGTLAADGIKRIAIYGANEIAEIAAVVAPEAGIEVIGVTDNDAEQEWVAGQKLCEFDDLLSKSLDALLICKNEPLVKEDPLFNSLDIPVYEIFDTN